PPPSNRAPITSTPNSTYMAATPPASISTPHATFPSLRIVERPPAPASPPRRPPRVSLAQRSAGATAPGLPQLDARGRGPPAGLRSAGERAAAQQGDELVGRRRHARTRAERAVEVGGHQLEAGDVDAELRVAAADGEAVEDALGRVVARHPAEAEGLGDVDAV